MAFHLAGLKVIDWVGPASAWFPPDGYLYSYHQPFDDTDSVDDPDYFAPAADRIRAGDRIVCNGARYRKHADGTIRREGADMMEAV